MDFGIGRRAGAEGTPREGTPAFMAPETLRGEPATVRSDIYSVGALLLALSTGRPPNGVSSRPLRELRPDLPEPFVRIIDRALDPNPGRRWSSAGKMAEAL
jgi:serine/threonine protein kinase